MDIRNGVALWREGPLVRMRLSRPKKKNALTSGMLIEMTTFLRLEPGDRALVLDAQGDDFCAGADLEDMFEARGSDSSFPEHLEAFLETLNRLEVPTLACVRGCVLGGAIGCLAVCDTVVSEVGAVFALPEVRLGLAPAVIAPFLKEKVSQGRMRDWFLRGSSFDEKEALQAGLIHAVVPKGDKVFLDKWVRDICSGAPFAQSYAKLLAKGLERGGVSGLHFLRNRPEAHEGRRAFFDKRRPDWRLQLDQGNH